MRSIPYLSQYVADMFGLRAAEKSALQPGGTNYCQKRSSEGLHFTPSKEIFIVTDKMHHLDLFSSTFRIGLGEVSLGIGRPGED